MKPMIEVPRWMHLRGLREGFDADMLMLMEADIDTLEKETQAGFPRTTKRLYSIQQVDVKFVNYLPYVGVKTLLVTSEVLGEQHEEGRKWYTPLILFTGIQYQDDPDEFTVTVKYKDHEYHFPKLSLTHTDCRVRCTCADFRYRFSWYNAQKKSLYGQPFKYKRKTLTRPPVNPLKVQGICKHIGKLATVLYNSGVLGY